MFPLRLDGRYNNPDNGGFEVALGADQKTGPGLVLIEGGRFTMGQVQQDCHVRLE